MDGLAEATTTSVDQEVALLRREIERLRADMRQVRSDLGAVSAGAMHVACAKAEETKEQIEEQARSAAARGRELARAVGEHVSEHSLAYVSGAFAVGVVIGLGLSRRN